MKINTFKKVAISTMALAMGAALVGSISGSVAWYQYSTRSTASYSGAAAHCTESLQVRLWRPEVAAEAPTVGAALDVDDVFEDGVKYYTREAVAGDVGKLHDGTYKYTFFKEGTGDALDVADAADKYFPVSAEGVDHVEEAGSETWSSDLRLAQVKSYLEVVRADANLRPVTSGALALNATAAEFKKEPIYQYEGMGSWKAASSELDYVVLPLEFRVVDVNGSRTAGDYDTFLAKKVYLTDLQMNSVPVDGKKDISDALRVGFDAAYDVTYSTTGEDVKVYGNLDLGGDAGLDIKETYDYYDFRYAITDAERLALTAEQKGSSCIVETTDTEKLWIWHDNAWTDISGSGYVRYGTADDQVAKSTQLIPGNLADDSDPYHITGSELGTTNADGSSFVVNVCIYLEGWQELTVGAGPAKSAVWSDVDYIGAAFKVNMRFSVEAHENH